MNTVRVRVAWGTPEAQEEIELELPEPASVQMAIDAARELAAEIATELANAAANVAGVGVWGKLRAPDHPLRDGDRVEIYRALQADPKDARRAKAKRSVGKTGKM
ncbi:MAG: RnfH family protein [Betaproteobacteria bacterium]